MSDTCLLVLLTPRSCVDYKARVLVESTPAAKALNIQGEYTLVVSSISLQLLGIVTQQVKSCKP